MKRKLIPVSLKDVKIEGGFWKQYIERNRKVTLPTEYEQCRKTGRINALKLNWKQGNTIPPHIFWDSDVAKLIEGAAYSLTTHPDAKLEKKIDTIINLIEKAQQKDGYLNTHFTVVEPKKRWSNLRDNHELYCAGHLIEAAVAYHEATGKRKFLDVMCRYADYIDSVFGPEPGKKQGYCGHPEIELALVKLYRTTTNMKYLKLAKFFIDKRGQKPYYFSIEAKSRGESPLNIYDYFQAHLPIRKQKTAEGHAVRVCYLYTGVADVAIETDDEKLFKTCKQIWRNITEKRMYIHGGIGSSRFGERFTFDYDLPNEEAYAETCASIALVFFAHRMLQIEPDRCYSDIIERALYNCILSSVSFDGKHFFYANYLASQPGSHRFSEQNSPIRQKWFSCACCPPNLARLLASLGCYIYSQTEDNLYIHLYIDSKTCINIGGQKVILNLKTDYPWKEKILLEVNPKQPVAFTIALRIPEWCKGVILKVNGKTINVKKIMEKGYVQIRRKWNKGNKIELHLPMPPERIEAHPSVRQDCGRVALQRGPIVYCLEEIDNGKNLNDIVLPKDAKLVLKNGDSIFGGIPLITSRAMRRDRKGWENKLYQSKCSRMVSAKIKAIPYFMWANRKSGEMLVWMRKT